MQSYTQDFSIDTTFQVLAELKVSWNTISYFIKYFSD